VVWVKKPYVLRYCIRCSKVVPESSRSDAVYCSKTCRASSEKARYCKKNPEYVKRQRKKSNEIRHKNTFGHTNYLDNPLLNKKDKFRVARSLGYRSLLEVSVADQLKSLGVPIQYETIRIPYKLEEVKKYTPDMILPNGIIVESKGRFLGNDRKKHLLIQKQHPNKDIRFVFSNSKAKINKGSKTSYADWCDKNKFRYADKLIPEEWLNE